MYYDPYEVFKDEIEPDAWRESIGDDGDVLVAIFYGSGAEARAKEYAAFQNQDIIEEN